ncbi:uba ts-n domain-containing protein [Cyclospora cayetanensis]|uniref:Uba ts-n domain-containing protein n=1 Tax=Cyclospora cayetanensis TaxID=88456 RepID=A0A1D3CS89_9EIME|nr:uba ts-n domain-containing protein [Cyclospora cayetanensis]
MDLRQEILQQQLRLLTLEAIASRRAAARSALTGGGEAAGGEAAAAADLFAQAPPGASAATESSASGAPQETSSGGENSGGATESAASAAGNSQPSLREIPVDLLNALPAAVRQAAVAGCRDSSTSGDASSAAAAEDAEFDNATFLATLEPALRQEVLLTADASVLEALPRELQHSSAAGNSPLPAAFVDASLALFGGFEGRWGSVVGGSHGNAGARLFGLPSASLLPRSIRLGLREALLDEGGSFGRDADGLRSGGSSGGDTGAPRGQQLRRGGGALPCLAQSPTSCFCCRVSGSCALLPRFLLLLAWQAGRLFQESSHFRVA